MLLPELNLPIGFAGKDGFYWWFGQVETEDTYKNSNRYKVRIVGQHVKSCTAVEIKDLPWAVCMFPVTHPPAEGNSTYTPTKLQKGTWVVGFFMDGAAGQQPVIMGAIGKVFKSTPDDSLSNNKNSNDCLAFERYVPDTNTILTQPSQNQDQASARPGGNGAVGQAIEATAGSEAGAPAGANPYARFGCQNLADAKCDDPTKTKSWFENVLTELFGAISQNGGQVGTQLLSKASGKLFDYASAANGYVSRVFNLAKAYLRAGKFKLYALIKEGIKSVVRFIMAIPTPPTGNPKTGEAIKKKRVGVLGKLTTWLNKQLAKINCSIADLEEKLFDFLTNLLYDLIKTAISSATCLVESIIAKILGELESFLTGFIEAILGPLQSILRIIASPLNIIGEALNYIFKLFGIQCSGNTGKCANAGDLTNCTGSANKKKPGEDDFASLDKLISKVEAGGTEDLQTSCKESVYSPCPELTTAQVYAGTPDPDRYSGPPEITLDDPEDSDFENYFDPIEIDSDVVTDTPEDPTEPAVDETISADFTAEVGGSVLTTTVLGGATTYNYVSSGNLNMTPGDSNNQFSPTFGSNLVTSYNLFSNKSSVSQGETIKFTLECAQGDIPDGTIFNYVMFGFIQQSDFVDNATSGTMVMRNNVAVKNITISDNISIENNEIVLFAVAQAGVAANFTIFNKDYEEDNSISPPGNPTFVSPVLGDPEVDDQGRIIFIPVVNPGDSYLYPPSVDIFGEGFGASASIKLDDDGRIERVVVERPGVNYIPNKNQKTNCVINNFVMIRPGIGYTSEPIVLVDGEENIARPILNENGNIVNVEVINKTKTFNKLPTIEIIGGGGSGAKMIPSLSCLGETEYQIFSSEVAPSGIDNVIDCP